MNIAQNYHLKNNFVLIATYRSYLTFVSQDTIKQFPSLVRRGFLTRKSQDVIYQIDNYRETFTNV